MKAIEEFMEEYIGFMAKNYGRRKTSEEIPFGIYARTPGRLHNRISGGISEIISERILSLIYRPQLLLQYCQPSQILTQRTNKA